MSQRMVNADIRRFFLSYTLTKTTRFPDGDSLRSEILKLLIKNNCLEIKGYTYSCILFTSKKDKDYDFWQKQIYRAFQQDIRFVFGEVAKRDAQYGEFEIGRFKSLRHEDKVFSAHFDKLVEKTQLETSREPTVQKRFNPFRG